MIVRNGENDTLVAFARQALATSALATQLADAGLEPVDDRPTSSTAADVRVEEIAADDSDRRAAAAVLSLVLYLILLILMIQVANGVAIEKANRISEVLLAVVQAGPLLFGKVIGVGLVGLAGLAAGAIPVVVKAIASGDLPAGLGPPSPAALPWMVLGLALYLTTAGALGALVERQEEAGSVLTPLSLLLIGTYVLAQSSADGSFGAFLAIFPYTSPIVMPARLALGDASAGEIVASLVVGSRRPLRAPAGRGRLPAGHRAHRPADAAGRGAPLLVRTGAGRRLRWPMTSRPREHQLPTADDGTAASSRAHAPPAREPSHAERCRTLVTGETPGRALDPRRRPCRLPVRLGRQLRTRRQR